MRPAEATAGQSQRGREWTAKSKVENDELNRQTQRTVLTKDEARIFVRSVNRILLKETTRNGGDVRESALDTYTSDEADGTTNVPKGFETIEDVVAAWKDRHSDGGAWINQAALNCGAFPHKRLMSGQNEGFLEYEEDEGVGGLDE